MNAQLWTRLAAALMPLLAGIACEPSFEANDVSFALALAALLNDGYEPGEEFSGGATTQFIFNTEAFDLPAANLSSARRQTFFTANASFDLNWVTAPSAAKDGLGPTFNNTSCDGCHVGDGRGAPPAGGGSVFNTMLFRISGPGADGVTGGPAPLGDYGTQFNNRAIAGVATEGVVSVSYAEEPGSFPDGEAYSLRRPIYNFLWNTNFNGSAGAAPTTQGADYFVSPRVAPAVYGLGLISAIPEAAILSRADENDADGDGVSGRANYVYRHASGATRLGRFGWKLNQPDLPQQNQSAFIGDIGITSPLFTAENCPGQQAAGACGAAVSGGSPEIDAANVDLINLYTHLVAVPGRRDFRNADVIAGKRLFRTIGCAACHAPGYRTGDLAGFPEVSNQLIRPYSDFLLHDMGDDLADGRTDFLANGREWRTAPLWGAGLIPTVNQHNNLLHDGRARGFQEAILWHGGEAEASRNRYRGLSRTERAQILRFLESL